MRIHRPIPQSDRHANGAPVGAALLLPLLLLAACTSEVPTGTLHSAAASGQNLTAATVSVCHSPRSTPAILEVARPALAAHLAHGDYVTTLVVSHADDLPTDDGVHFRRITDALGAVRDGRIARGELLSAACRVTIVVSAGRYEGTVDEANGDLEQLPLMVDIPDITLLGATRLTIDATGRPTADAEEGIETVLAPVTRLPVVASVQTPIIVANGRPGGSAAHGLVVEGFVFTSGPTAGVSGQGVLGVRVNDLLIRGNRFDGGFSESIDLRAGSGAVLQNHATGPGGSCDICLAAPGRYRAIGNRLISGGIPGIPTSAVVGLPLPAGVEPHLLPAAAEVWTEVRNNEVRDHLRVPVGVGIRVETVGTMAPNVHNIVHSVIQDNLIVNNRFGVIVHAGFPVNGTALRGDADITLGGNVIAQSCQTKLLVSMSRHQRTFGLNNALPYLQGSTYQVSLGGDVAWDDVWFDHPADRGNQLLVDGAPIANGIRHFYSAGGCPGL